MSYRIKLGIIGCGRAAELIYSPALTRLSGVEVTAVLDPIEERTNLISSKFNNCMQFKSLDSNFIRQIDAAIISTPPETHITAASELLKMNKHVLVEKPLALTTEGLKDLLDSASSSKASLMMGFNHRYWHPVIRLKEELPENLIAVSADIIFTGNYSRWDPISFKSDPLNDLGPHVFDLVRYIFNKEITSVSASTKDNNIDVKIIMPDVSIHAQIAHCSITEKTIKIISGDLKYFIRINSTRTNPWLSKKRKMLDLQDIFKRKLLRKTSPLKNSYELQLKDFFDVIRGNKKSVPGIKDGISAVSAVEAAVESINNNGKEIFLNEIK